MAAAAPNRTIATVWEESDDDEEEDDELFSDDFHHHDHHTTTMTTTTTGNNNNKMRPIITTTVKRSSLTPTSFRTKIQIRQRPYVYRMCTVRITHLELLTDLSSSAGYFQLAVRIRGQRMKHVLRSDPIMIPNHHQQQQHHHHHHHPHQDGGSNTAASNNHNINVSEMKANNDTPNASPIITSVAITTNTSTATVAAAAGSTATSLISPPGATITTTTNSTGDDQLLNISLDLQFQAEYLHFLKGKPARLHVLLQKPHRRIRNQFKTLASAHVGMDEVLQAPLNDTVVLESSSTTLERLQTHHKKITPVARIDLQVKSVLIQSSTAAAAGGGGDDDATAAAAAAAAVETFEYEEDSDDDEKDDAAGGGKFKERTEKFLASLKQRWKQRFSRKEEPDGAVSVFDDDEMDSDSVSRRRSFTTMAHLRAAYLEPVETQVANLFPVPVSNAPVELPSHVILVQLSSSRCQRLLEWCDMKMSNNGGHESVLRNVVAVDGRDQTKAAFKAAVTKYKQGLVHNSTLHQAQLSIVVAGGDSCLTHVLQAYVELLSRERRGWEKLRIFLLPLGHGAGDNQVAKWVAGVDHVYRGIFFSSAWLNAYATNEPWLQAQGEQMEAMVTRYLNDAGVVLKLPIAEALIDLVAVAGDDDRHKKSQTGGGGGGGGGSSSTARSIPFVKSIRITTSSSATHATPTTNASIGDSPHWPSFEQQLLQQQQQQQHEASVPPLQLGAAAAAAAAAAVSNTIAGTHSPPTSPTNTTTGGGWKKGSSGGTGGGGGGGGIPTLHLDYWPLRGDKKLKKQSMREKFHEVVVKRWLHVPSFLNKRERKSSQTHTSPAIIPTNTDANTSVTAASGGGAAEHTSTSAANTSGGGGGGGNNSSSSSSSTVTAATAASVGLAMVTNASSAAASATPTTPVGASVESKTNSPRGGGGGGGGGMTTSTSGGSNHGGGGGGGSSNNEVPLNQQLFLKAVTTKDHDKHKKPDIICLTKLICSTKAGHFSVLIDGGLWDNVNFVSVSPQWTANARTLPIASFVSLQQDDTEHQQQ